MKECNNWRRKSQNTQKLCLVARFLAACYTPILLHVPWNTIKFITRWERCLVFNKNLTVWKKDFILYIAVECSGTFSLTFVFFGVSWLSSSVVALFLFIKVLLLNSSGANFCPTTWVQRHSSILCSSHSPLGSLFNSFFRQLLILSRYWR